MKRHLSNNTFLTKIFKDKLTFYLNSKYIASFELYFFYIFLTFTAFIRLIYFFRRAGDGEGGEKPAFHNCRIGYIDSYSMKFIKSFLCATFSISCEVWWCYKKKCRLTRLVTLYSEVSCIPNYEISSSVFGRGRWPLAERYREFLIDYVDCDPKFYCKFCSICCLLYQSLFTLSRTHGRPVYKHNTYLNEFQSSIKLKDATILSMFKYFALCIW